MLKKVNSLEVLLSELAPLRAKLLNHPIYQAIDTLEELQIFMESHCFAVWDFMTLLKSLQQKLTCVQTPWIPPENPMAARMVNEIVLCEESDEISPGHYRGHFDLYVEAMGEISANGGLILDFVKLLKQGIGVEKALSAMPLPLRTKSFVLNTMAMAQRGSSHEVAAAFLFGREDVIPEMFDRILKTLELGRTHQCRAFKTYLERHIEVDGAEHSEMGRRILQHLCGTDAGKWSEAFAAAQQAILARLSLWDGIMSELGKEKHASALSETSFELCVG